MFLGDYHGLIDFARYLRDILGEATREYVVIAMDERLYTEHPTTYIVKSMFSFFISESFFVS